LIDERTEPELKAAFLSVLAAKGETVEEISAFARHLRRLAVPVAIEGEVRQREILDVCGTGGDRLNTFNVSTTVALLVAAAGVTVAKHGNRAITSKCGSADILEALGIRTDLSPTEAGAWLRERHFAFLFAPQYHPAFRHLAPARRLCAERGQRTIFNFLGPLLNPVPATVQLMGVPNPGLCAPLARVLQSLGVRRGMVVTGRLGGNGENASAFLDELSTLGPTAIAEFHHDRGFLSSELGPENFPLQAVTLTDLAGGDATRNAAITRGILSGSDRSPRRDAVLLNAGAALVVAGRVRSIAEGWDLADETIGSGKAAAKLEALVEASRRAG
jgi:anthranilate phosphoribosyltransferase